MRPLPPPSFAFPYLVTLEWDLLPADRERKVKYMSRSGSDPRRRLWLWHSFVCRFDIRFLPSEVLDSSCLSIGTFVNCIVLRVKVFIGIYLRIYLSTEGTVSIISSSPSPIYPSGLETGKRKCHQTTSHATPPKYPTAPSAS